MNPCKVSLTGRLLRSSTTQLRCSMSTAAFSNSARNAGPPTRASVTLQPTRPRRSRRSAPRPARLDRQRTVNPDDWSLAERQEVAIRQALTWRRFAYASFGLERRGEFGADLVLAEDVILEVDSVFRAADRGKPDGIVVRCVLEQPHPISLHERRAGRTGEGLVKQRAVGTPRRRGNAGRVGGDSLGPELHDPSWKAISRQSATGNRRSSAYIESSLSLHFSR